MVSLTDRVSGNNCWYFSVWHKRFISVQRMKGKGRKQGWAKAKTQLPYKSDKSSTNPTGISGVTWANRIVSLCVGMARAGCLYPQLSQTGDTGCPGKVWPGKKSLLSVAEAAAEHFHEGGSRPGISSPSWKGAVEWTERDGKETRCGFENGDIRVILENGIRNKNWCLCWSTSDLGR